MSLLSNQKREFKKKEKELEKIAEEIEEILIEKDIIIKDISLLFSIIERRYQEKLKDVSFKRVQEL